MAKLEQEKIKFTLTVFAVFVMFVGSAFAQTKTLYFLPPEDEKWAFGVPHFVYSTTSGLVKEKFVYAPTSRCGWYKKEWPSGTPLPAAPAWIWRSKDDPEGQLGVHGVNEDEADWQYGMPEPFYINTKLNGGNNVYFYAEADKGSEWSTTQHNADGNCGYPFAAIIYDTDHVNTSFNNNNSGPDGNDDGANSSATGIRKGIPKSELVFDNTSSKWKMAFNQAKNGWTANNFRDAFQPTADKNVVRCYNMPFKRNKNGLWEFNSDKLCRDGSMDLENDCKHINPNPSNYWSNFQGGYFPPELQNDGSVSYTSCPTCNTKRDANNFVRINTSTISQFCYERGRSGTHPGPDINQCGSAFGEGDFRNGDRPGIWQNDWSAGKSHMGVGTTANELFCFESTPADFTYDPSQEFFFSGDDDIWVFISNHLVIDLGGAHLAAPGYVKLSELKIPQAARIPGKRYESDGRLVEDEKYPMNIFFCDRRTNMSNVRIATNIYFAQQSALTASGDPRFGTSEICYAEEGSAGSCEAVMSGGGGGGSKTCGAAMGNILDYYMTGVSSKVTYQLNPSNPQCVQSGDDLVCYGGIYLRDYYKAPTIGAVQTVVTIGPYTGGLVGTWKIYAKVNKPGSEGTKPVEVGKITVGAKESAVWGRILNENGDLIFDLGPKNKETVAGKLVPIGFSVGAWGCANESEHGKPGCEFTAFLAPAVEFGALGALVGVPPVQSPQGQDQGILNALKFYKDPNGVVELKDQPRLDTVPANTNKGPYPGLLVYWVTGDERATDDNVHLIGKDVSVKVHLPRIRFVDTLTVKSNPTLVPDAARRGSDPTLPKECVIQVISGGNRIDATYTGASCQGMTMGEYSKRAVVAYDISYNGMEICKTCDFDLSIDAKMVTRDATTGAITNVSGVSPEEIVASDPERLKMVHGVMEFSIYGGGEPVRLDLGEPTTTTGGVFRLDTFAFLSVRGPNQSKPETFATWDSLLFKPPPVPYPRSVGIFDANGDGHGDSLRIIFDRPFPACEVDPLRPTCVAGILDTLPSMIEIFWDPDSVFRVGPGKPSATDPAAWTTTGNSKTDYDFWNGGSTGKFKTKIEHDSVLIIYGDQLSAEIKTAAAGTAYMLRWATYVPDGATDPVDARHRTVIRDSIPAIVVKAVYESDKNKCGSGPGAGACNDQIELTLSEPVKAADIQQSNEIIRSPFAYKLFKSRGFRDFQRFDQEKNLYKGVLRSRGDSVFNLTYQRYRTSNDTSSTPMAGDSVKFVSELLGLPTYVDMVGNKPNPREIGKLFEGRNPIRVDDILITELDPDRDLLDEALRELFPPEIADTLFRDDKQIAFLPTDPSWGVEDVRTKYPASLGSYINIDVAGELNSILVNEMKLGDSIRAEDITFFARAYYHTSLGNYVVKGPSIVISCADPVFSILGADDMEEPKDCRSDKGFYLAWNLRDAKNRWVGTGAYIQLYDFHWEIKYTDKFGVDQTKVPDKIDRKVTMHGVKRAKRSR